MTSETSKWLLCTWHATFPTTQMKSAQHHDLKPLIKKAPASKIAIHMHKIKRKKNMRITTCKRAHTHTHKHTHTCTHTCRYMGRWPHLLPSWPQQPPCGRIPSSPRTSSCTDSSAPSPLHPAATLPCAGRRCLWGVQAADEPRGEHALKQRQRRRILVCP